jgi:D-alanine-D-alanine ligase-like ATP-grasp enzyme
MRIGQGGSNLDNAHAGGMFIAVDDNGTLHEKAFTEFKKEFIEHPDTHLKFNNYKIDFFPEVLKAAVKCHSMIPQLGCINWDFTIDANGDPILIEANLRGGGIWMLEMAHGCGPFGDKTPEILRWMKKMKYLKFTEREPYRYGEM